MLLKIRDRAEFIKIKNIVADCRDPKDNFLLSLSVDGKATHLIAGDKDLLVLKVYGKTKILTMTEFCKKKTVFKSKLRTRACITDAC